MKTMIKYNMVSDENKDWVKKDNVDYVAQLKQKDLQAGYSGDIDPSLEMVQITDNIALLLTLLRPILDFNKAVLGWVCTVSSTTKTGCHRS